MVGTIAPLNWPCDHCGFPLLGRVERFILRAADLRPLVVGGAEAAPPSLWRTAGDSFLFMD